MKAEKMKYALHTELVPVAGGTRLVHTGSFRGVMVPVLRRSLDGNSLAGFHAMNTAREARAEAGNGTR